MEFDVICPENKADAFDAECGKIQKTMRARVKPAETWISKSKFEIEHEEELLACRRIILKIVRYMKDNNMSHRDHSRLQHGFAVTVMLHFITNFSMYILGTLL